ncbi:hypothetical protein HanRHA438_Chr15g0732941 [Helianthus annuus]|uniref:Uncharacterized protein n=1 Tax=Helianthus annuus TaxID=4232 RepID=A0A9K3E669_HELAN|nr:hypothetical protein HanXRQr2_Chr15g0720451 [Helianthus annuus]KAJ0458361.1 hypothetical protein HanIR_Chr15g0784171 [Helianthus annuus]KAJ0847153.1 hypothetical protein HanRHA438_Chr15g0732941 [Helianthus annuus]
MIIIFLRYIFGFSRLLSKFTILFIRKRYSFANQRPTLRTSHSFHSSCRFFHLFSRKQPHFHHLYTHFRVFNLGCCLYHLILCSLFHSSKLFCFKRRFVGPIIRHINRFFDHTFRVSIFGQIHFMGPHLFVQSFNRSANHSKIIGCSI